MTANTPTVLPGGSADLQVTESSKGRTTKVRLPNGEVVQRTSKTRAYTHAVVVTEDNHAHAAEVQRSMERRQAYIDALEAWIARGSNMAELKAYPSATLSVAEREAGASKTEYYLPGFEPVQKTFKANRRFGGSGGRYWDDPNGFSLPNPDDKHPLRYAEGRTVWEEYGPDHVLKDQRGRLESEQHQADKLRAAPQYSYGVWRWSGDRGNAQGYANQVGQGEDSPPWRTARVVGVGSDVKETPKPKGPTAEERAAAKAASEAAVKAASADRDAKFVSETRQKIQDAIAEGRDPEGPIAYTTEAGLRFLAKAYGVKLPRLPRSAYGTPQPLDRANARRLIVEAIRDGVKPAGRTPGGHLTGAAALDAAPAKVRGGTLTLPGWTAAEKATAVDALEHYRDIGFTDLNRDLRAGIPSSTKGRNTTGTVDKVMEASRLSAPVTVYRGVANAGLFRAGGTVTDAAYGSATADLGTARGFAGKGGAVLRLRVPAGVGAVNLSDMPGGGKADEREGELLLQRGLRYRVVGESTEGGVRVIDVEIIPGPITPVRAGATAQPRRPAGLPKLNRNIR